MTTTQIPRFRGDESAIAVYRHYAVHRIGGVLVLYHKHEHVGLVETLPSDVATKHSVQCVLQEAKRVTDAWNGLSA